MPLKWIVKVLKVLNSNRNPGEIASGAAFGLMLALQPGLTFFRTLILVAVFFLKTNLAAVMIFLLVLAGPALLLDGLSDSLGGAILTAGPLQGFFTRLYNLPLVPLTGFNDTLVLGGLVLGVLLWVPAYLGARKLVGLYRERLRDRLAGHPAVKWFLRLPVISTMAKLAGKAYDAYSALQ